jgi:nucleotide-binding universal stress UspA family protein
MVTKLSFRVLSISDIVEEQLGDSGANNNFGDIDFLLACGDLPYHYIEKVMASLRTPAFFVRGNHDKKVEYGTKGARTQPLGAVDLHCRVINFNNLLLAGFEGSVGYQEGGYMYTQSDMWMNVLSLVPRLLWNKVVYGRFLDILITHAPPWGIHDKSDWIHQGFKSFTWLLKTFKPSFHFHGHIHVLDANEQTETVFNVTKVINTYGHKMTVVRPRVQHAAPKVASVAGKRLSTSAAEDFRVARRKAALESILASVTRKSVAMTSFEQIRQQFGSQSAEQRGLCMVPLDAIVGSVGRQEDFTRKFFPRKEHDRERWIRVRNAIGSVENMPPIDVYKIGDMYFVLDGNHRVSIARQSGYTHIQAFVTEIESKISLLPEDSPDDLIIKSQLAKFLEETGLDELRPDVDFSVTSAGLYRQLKEQISLHQFEMELWNHYPVEYEAAVLDWTDNVYLPVVRMIRKQGLLREFPDCTPTDIYLWVVEHRKDLAHKVGWNVKTEHVLEDLVVEHSPFWGRRVARLQRKILDSILPRGFRRATLKDRITGSQLVTVKEDGLFSSILTLITGEEHGWVSLEQAIAVSKLEKGTIYGVHVAPHSAAIEAPQFAQLRTRFDKIFEHAGEKGVFTVDFSESVAETVAKLSPLNDLVVFSLAHPPSDKALDRLRSGLRMLIQVSPRPLLAVPAFSHLSHGLLAYDGSPKANEALYLAAYMAARWGITLSVISSSSGEDNGFEIIAQAKEYLGSRNVTANYIQDSGEPGEAILKAARECQADFIIMGGFGHSPVVEVVIGSTLDKVLREFTFPIFICQ